jgi:hypothetical protein
MRCHGLLLLLTLLFSSSPAPAQGAAPRVPDPLAALRPLLSEALARMRLSPAELGYEKKLVDPWSLSGVVRVLDDPLETPRRAMELRYAAGRFAQAKDLRSLLGCGLELAEQRGGAKLWPEPGARASAASAWRVLLGSKVSESELPRPELEGGAAEGWRLLSVALASLARAQRDSWSSSLSAEQERELMAQLPRIYDVDAPRVLKGLGEDSRDRARPGTGDSAGLAEASAALQLALRLDLESLGTHALGSLLLIEQAVQALRSADWGELPTPLQVEGITGDLRYFIDTPMGAVAIGGPGPTQYHRDLFVVIDLGGDDQYRGRVAAASQLWNRPVSLCLDLGGSDVYSCEDPLNQGAALLGCALLIDLGAGDDQRLAGDLAQGAALLGLGLLLDDGGDDVMRAGAFVQGAASFGLGLFGDVAGSDIYDARRNAQGFGGIRGYGALLDVEGHDVYRALGDGSPGGRARSQGFGSGERGLRASGGVALLWDGQGDDAYSCDVHGQGGGYWMGLGMLVDEAGHDRYACTQYGQGVAVHMAAGLLWDLQGEDRYALRHGFGQGAGHDLAIGMLLEAGGNDSYLGAGMDQGAGSANGFGLLLELGGDDVYAGALSRASRMQGYAEAARDYGSIGMLLDLAGRDHIATRPPGLGRAPGRGSSPAGKDVAPVQDSWQRGQHGLVWDRGYLVSEEELLPVAGSVEHPPRRALAVPEPLPAANADTFARLWARAARLQWGGIAADVDQARRTLIQLGPSAGRWILDQHLSAGDTGSLRALRVILAGIGKELLPEIRDRLSDERPRALRNALDLLGRMRDLGALERILQLLGEDPPQLVKHAIARALGQIGAENTLPAFDAYVRSERPEDRRVAAAALGGIPGKAAVHRLADLLGDASFTVRDAARTSLLSRKEDALSVGLDELGLARLPALREWLRLFAEWRPEEARLALRRLAQHADPHVVREAGRILAELDRAKEEAAKAAAAKKDAAKKSGK